MGGLYRDSGTLLYHLAATGMPVPVVRQFATARARPRKPKKKTAPSPGRPVPGLILLTLVRLPYPWECDLWSAWNCLGLGPWRDFDRRELVAEVRRRAG